MNLRRGTIFWVAHNRNHVEIFERSHELLVQAGASVVCVAVPGFVPSATAEFRRRGLPWLTPDQIRSEAARGDVIVVGNDWLPPNLCDRILAFKGSGIRTVAFVEGCRFVLPNKYTRVDELLGWGPSATRLPPQRVHVVGSPILEKTLSRRRGPADKKFTLVNYRFKPTPNEGELGAAWLEAAVSCCQRTGSNIIISAHPASGLVDRRYQVSSAPIEELLGQAALLISRCSTVIYQALILGTPAILFPTLDEELGEFAEPMGAFPIARNASDLGQLVTAHYRQLGRFESGDFLASHVDIDPHRPASQRIAEVLANMTDANSSRFA